MAQFGKRSKERLATMHPDMQRVLVEVVKHFDCTILEGHRDEARQEKLFLEGKSKVRWPDSKHNKKPSDAADVIPYPVDWEDTNRMRLFAGFVLGIAISMGIRLRWGGDWDQDTQVKDNKFNDLPHFERRRL